MSLSCLAECGFDGFFIINVSGGPDIQEGSYGWLGLPGREGAG